MKTLMKTLITALFSLLLFSSCKKHDHDHDHSSSGEVTAEINILSPTQGNVYKKGDNIALEADVLGSGELHGYAVYIKTTDTDSVVFNHIAHSHGKSFQIRQNYVNNLSRTVDLKVTYEVAITHSGKTTVKEVTVRADAN
jgi:hypothetical protein